MVTFNIYFFIIFPKKCTSLHRLKECSHRIPSLTIDYQSYPEELSGLIRYNWNHGRRWGSGNDNKKGHKENNPLQDRCEHHSGHCVTDSSEELADRGRLFTAYYRGLQAFFHISAEQGRTEAQSMICSLPLGILMHSGGRSPLTLRSAPPRDL